MTTTRAVPLAASALLAVGALGLLINPAPSNAGPCDKWTSIGSTFNFNQDNGYIVNVEVAGDNSITEATYSGSGRTVNGSAYGSIKGVSIDFTANWDSGPSGNYHGTIQPDGTASGYTTSSSNDKTNWHTPGPEFRCVPIATPVNAPPVNVPPVNVPPPPGHTVTSSVDLYAKPGGKGKPIGSLQAGDAVTLNGPCPIQSNDATNGWCLVTDTTQNKSGAVWGDYISK